MAKYYVNQTPQENGDHEVHEKGCSYMPSAAKRLYLGEFTNCHDAVKEAKLHYPQSNGCQSCSSDCHTG